jgi:hypothetical protein
MSDGDDDEVMIYHDGHNNADVVAVDDGIIEWLRRKEEAMGRRWNDETDKKLCALWATTMTQTAIARELGFSAAFVCMQAEALGLPPRSATNSAELRSYLFAEAAKRGLTPRTLREKIIATVAKARLVGAVLDDEVAEAKEDQNADAL